MCAKISEFVKRLVIGWTARGSNPGVSEIFRTSQDRPWGLTNLLYNGHITMGVKRPGRGVDPLI
jgi:hypothetical protein